MVGSAWKSVYPLQQFFAGAPPLHLQSSRCKSERAASICNLRKHFQWNFQWKLFMKSFLIGCGISSNNFINSSISLHFGPNFRAHTVLDDVFMIHIADHVWPPNRDILDIAAETAVTQVSLRAAKGELTSWINLHSVTRSIAKLKSTKPFRS